MDYNVNGSVNGFLKIKPLQLYALIFYNGYCLHSEVSKIKNKIIFLHNGVPGIFILYINGEHTQKINISLNYVQKILHTWISET